MNTTSAQKAILVSAIFTFAFGFIHSLSPEQIKKHGDFPSTFHARLFVGTGITFILLAGVAEFAPGVAGPMAILVATTATVASGGEVINYVLSLVQPEKKTKNKNKSNLETTDQTVSRVERNLRQGKAPLTGLPGYPG